jgi:hypothetical protein
MRNILRSFTLSALVALSLLAGCEDDPDDLDDGGTNAAGSSAAGTNAGTGGAGSGSAGKSGAGAGGASAGKSGSAGADNEADAG